MLRLPRLILALCLMFGAALPALGQSASIVETEVRAVEPDRVILLGGTELPVAADKDGNYGPLLDNYEMLTRVGYIDLARLHIVQGVVVQVEVIRMLQ